MSSHQFFLTAGYFFYKKLFLHRKKLFFRKRDGPDNFFKFCDLFFITKYKISQKLIFTLWRDLQLKRPASQYGRAFMAHYKCLCNIQFPTLIFCSEIVSFNIKLFKIKYSIGICILNVYYFNSIASNTIKTKNVWKNYLF